MTVYFKDIDNLGTIDIGVYGKSGMDVSPMDIPLKGDVIKDDFNRCWEVIEREHYWTGPTHYMTLRLKRIY